MLSLILPCYNEAGNIEGVAGALLTTFRVAGEPLELILVDNGSEDATGEVLTRLAALDERVRPVRLQTNAGYGGGILAGAAAAGGSALGYATGDGQVDAADVLRAWRLMQSDGLEFVKGHRITRQDGRNRMLISRIYNLTFKLMFRAPFGDVNGTPKLFSRALWERLEIESRDWFIDAEVALKLGRIKSLRMGEIPITFFRRETGESQVSLRTVLEFVRNMPRWWIKGIGARQVTEPEREGRTQ